MRKFLIGLVLCLGGGWAAYTLFFAPEPVALEPAVSLTQAQQATVEGLYGVAPGDHALAARTLEVPGPDNDPLQVRVTWPAGDGKLPVILFSHGNFSEPGQYDRLVQHWASHGYLVVEPYHLDAGGVVNGIIAMTIHGQQEVLVRRPADLQATLNALPALEQLIPDLSGRVDRSRIMAAGHSFGAFAAQMLGGASGFADSGEPLQVSDPRITAVLAISPPGPMFGLITGDSWRDMTLPAARDHRHLGCRAPLFSANGACMP